MSNIVTVEVTEVSPITIYVSDAAIGKGIKGDKGDTGPQGEQGVAGADGNGTLHGFVRTQPDSLGVLELSIDGSTIYKIDSDGSFSKRTDGMFASGTAFETVASPRTFAIYPKTTTFTYYRQGVKNVVDTIKLFTSSAVSGYHGVYFGEDGEVHVSNGFSSDLYLINTYIAGIYYNAIVGDKVVFADERHGILMSPSTIYHLHRGIGALPYTGFGIEGATAGATEYVNLSAGVFGDEDIIHTVMEQTNSPFWYKDGSIWRGVGADLAFGYKTTESVFYNKNTDGLWHLESVANNNYCLVHFFVTNDAEYPYVKVLGRAQYDSVTSARVGAKTEVVNLALEGLPSQEFLVAFTIIINHTGEVVLNDLGTAYINWLGNYKFPYKV